MSETWYVGYPRSRVEVEKLCVECQHMLADSQQGLATRSREGDGGVSREKRDEPIEMRQWT